jgi:hypothetical protein
MTAALLVVVIGAVWGWQVYDAQIRSEWSPARIRESKEEGDRIAAMLLRFHRENGRFPAALDELVPKYLPEIRPPAAGKGEWEYRVLSDRCELKFCSKAGRPCFVTDTSKNEWRAEN